MSKGKTLTQLAQELERQRQTKRDFIVTTRRVNFEAFTKDKKTISRISFYGDNGKPESFDVGDLAHRQIAERLDIPYKYYERMLRQEPTLLQQNVSTWLLQKKERRLIRTLDGRARAFLSDRYNCMDNFAIAEAVLPILSEMPGARVDSCELTEKRMYIKIVNPSLTGEVKVGDVVQAGVAISNSETGQGAVNVNPFVWRKVCSNGLIIQDAGMSKFHIGKQISGDDNSEIFSDETKQAADRAFISGIKDVVRAAADQSRFEAIINTMRDAAHRKIVDVEYAVEVLSNRFPIYENERKGVLRHLIEGGDLSQWGMVNAVTRTAQDVDSYDRATELESTGGRILDLSGDEWRKITAKN